MKKDKSMVVPVDPVNSVNLDRDYKHLKKLINHYDITRYNFIILISQVIDYYRQTLKYDQAKTYLHGTTLLKRFVNDMDLQPQEKIYLEQQILNKTNGLLVLEQKHLEPKKILKRSKSTVSHSEPNKSRSSLIPEANIYEMTIDEIIDHIYSKLVKMITIKDLTMLDLTYHMLELVENVMVMVDEFHQLNSLKKKRIIVKIFHMLADQANDIFVDLKESDLLFLKMAIEEIPDLIDVISLIINSPIVISPKLKGFFSRICRLFGFKCCQQKET